MTQGPSSRAYVVRLWRGEVPLEITYWGWGFIFGAALRLSMLVGLLLTGRNVAVGVGVLIIYLAYVVFMIVAVWRSAGRYSGPRIWRDLARISIGIVLLMWLADRFLNWPAQ